LFRGIFTAEKFLKGSPVAIKNTAKKSTASKKLARPKSKSESYGPDIFAWFLIFAGSISLIALFSHFFTKGVNGANLLGPYLGNFLAIHISLFMGKFPVLLFAMALISGGINLLRRHEEQKGIRFTLVFLLLFLETGLLLALRVADVELTQVHYENNGGVFNSFLVEFLVRPIFAGAYFAPYALLWFALFLTLLWGTPLKVDHITNVFKMAFKGFKLLINQIKAPKTPVKTTQSIPLKPLKSPRFLKVDHSEPETGLLRTGMSGRPIPLDIDNMGGGEGHKVHKRIPTGASNRSENIENRESTLLPESEMDAMALRKYRDELAEKRRIEELNRWEDKKENALKIQGLLKTEEPTVQIQPQMKTPVENSAQNQSPKKGVPSENGESFNRIQKPGESEAEAREFDEYVVPDVRKFLPTPPEQTVDYSEEELKAFSLDLEAALSNFRVQGKVVGICTGPVITRFEIELAPGIKVSRISGLSDDLALALKAKTIRILAPIPGKSAVGIEVPNRNSHIVYVRSILESRVFDPKPDNIKIVLGKDIAGDPYVMDLAKAPHLLIAGQTGSGKSVCINTLMASILCSKSPEELRMILVDPKVVELKPYEKIPHLLHPVVTDPETAVQALKWACWEMDRRYEVLAKARVRNLAGYNDKFVKGKLEGLVDDEDNARMCFIVIIIDELADLMMVAGKDVEISIARIAQKARAVGIHLVLATQRPSTNVITGTIKANLPTRISFKVASHIDARTIMDKAGAEKLLGRGDMLFRSITDPEPVRVHGAFLEDDEAELLADAAANQNVDFPQLEGFTSPEDDLLAEMAESGPRDDKFAEAAELVVSVGGASTSMLQRRMSIGYAKAGRIIDQLEAAGIVGPERGSKPREVLMQHEELMSFLSGNLDDL
jgi:DNA segregation ATPase FtsK/SpoIIIE-like protein